jgi:hypothetical protein
MEARKLFRGEVKNTIYDKSYVQKLVHKWKPLLEGIPQGYTRNVMAVLCENQSSALKRLDEDTRSSNVGSFIKFIFPILRRVWPNLYANELVSVQPMTAPVGAVFYYELKYGTAKGTVNQGDFLVKNFNFTYSSEMVDGELLGTGNGGTYTFSKTLAFTPIRPGTVCILVSPATKTVVGAGSVSGVSLGVGCDPTIEDAYTFAPADEQAGSTFGSKQPVGDSVATDNGANVIAGTGITGTINYTGGQLSVTFGTAPGAGVKVAVQYQYDMEANTNIPQVNLDIQLSEVRARTRKLKALWSSESADDLKAFHGIDAEAELVAGIAAEIALEIDREIINDLQLFATGATGTFSRTVPSGMVERDHLSSIVLKLSQISNQIHRNSLRGPANWIVTSTEVSALIESLSHHGDFRPIFAGANAGAHDAPETPQTFGIYKVGTLQSKWMVYKDPYFPANKALLGYKGGTFIDAGYVWAPYVPLQVTATFLDPNDFTFRKGLRTRYAKKLVRSEYYGVLNVTGL